MIDRHQLRKKLPRGYGKVVSDRCGLSPQSVSRYFNYKQNSERIECAVLDILIEISERKKKQLNEIL